MECVQILRNDGQQMMVGEGEGKQNTKSQCLGDEGGLRQR